MRTRRRRPSSSIASTSRKTRRATSSSQRQHLYVLDVASRKVDALTSGRFMEAYRAGRRMARIAFMSKRGADPDRNNEFGLYTIDRRPDGAEVYDLVRQATPAIPSG